MATLAQKVRGIRKGRRIKVKASANVAKVTAWRALGAGKFEVTSAGKSYAYVKRLA